MRNSLASLLVMFALSCAPGLGADRDEKAGPDRFAFHHQPPSAYRAQVDFLGVSLLATTLLDRDDGYNCDGVNNQGNLLAIAHGLVRKHRMWSDDIAARGLPVCQMDVDGEPTAGNVLDYLRSLPCTAQRIRREGEFESWEAPRVIDLIVPDHATVNLDGPTGFPNGRHPKDQITDLILAMGFVDLNRVTADDVKLNPAHNDVPFPDGFPYLAPAHASRDQASYRRPTEGESE